ncbi:olfactory receptor 4P4-like [Suncus etruscus]|uniref:olfactory receptor 4P4-like n=1 Tax=Suncus etruscus TaxID=109475 RepID=UPI00210F5A9B|nr:olfactory receptor 4P4-like [Suncus etruscus]
MESHRNISEFVLRGLSYSQQIQIFCFVFFSFCYILLLGGNILIIISVQLSHLVNQPMYYFLVHLSSIDICYTSTVTPKLIADLLVERKTISYSYCMFQVFVLHFFGGIEIFILTAMAYDRYVAICKPLHYMLIMNRTKCKVLLLATWICGAAHAFPLFSIVVSLPFCDVNEIDHYFCDVFPLIEIACTDTFIDGMLVIAFSGLVISGTFVVLLISYVIILFSLRNQSAEGRQKALSTCGTHIIVVILWFVPAIFIYLRPPTTFPEDKIFSLFYTIISPMFNPLIYSLRNREMKSTMKKVWCQKLLSKEVHK